MVNILKLVTSAHPFLYSNGLLSGERGIVDKSSWQHGESNHCPPDVGLERKREGGERRRGALEKPAATTTSATPPLEVIYPYADTLTPHLTPPHPTQTHIKFSDPCIRTLDLRRRPGQAVFTAEVIGGVWIVPVPAPV